jgi:uncharacterized protein YjhX (UPF0386 family)
LAPVLLLEKYVPAPQKKTHVVHSLPREGRLSVNPDKKDAICACASCVKQDGVERKNVEENYSQAV